MKTKVLDEYTAREVYDHVRAHLEHRAKEAEGHKKPIPHPFSFMLSTYEEQQAELEAVRNHNARCDSTASVCRDIAYVMEYSYITAPAEEQTKEDLNRFGAGI